MKSDALRQFVALRGQLLREKESLERRLADINAALGAMPQPPSPAPAARAGATPRQATPRRTKSRRPVEPGAPHPSLREAFLAATQAGPLTRQELLKAVVAHGYRFKSRNPLNALGAFLYTDPCVRNDGGRFGPA